MGHGHQPPEYRPRLRMPLPPRRPWPGQRIQNQERGGAVDTSTVGPVAPILQGLYHGVTCIPQEVVSAQQLHCHVPVPAVLFILHQHISIGATQELLGKLIGVLAGGDRQISTLLAERATMQAKC